MILIHGPIRHDAIETSGVRKHLHWKPRIICDVEAARFENGVLHYENENHPAGTYRDDSVLHAKRRRSNLEQRSRR